MDELDGNVFSIMETRDLNNLLLRHFAFEPTPGQRRVLLRLSEFLLEKEGGKTFVLKGYAGTGKTTMVQALVKCLPVLEMKFVLLAPTGRAAKVLSNYAQKSASTIHKRIYRKATAADGLSRYMVQPNKNESTLFIVDEASMIGAGGRLVGGFGQERSLLDDLMGYVRAGKNCSLLFIGDVAQLPPVGSNISPALDLEDLKRAYSISLKSDVLKDVVRQQQESGILANATRLRGLIEEGFTGDWKFELKGFTDIVRLEGGELEDALNSAYGDAGVEGTTVICRSNKRAVLFNQQIRARIRWQEEELSAGDHLMVVKNNYHWLPEESAAGFIANGDTIALQKITGFKTLYGYRFADAKVALVDYPNEPALDVKIILDALTTEAPALSHEQNNALYQAVLEDYQDIKDKRKRFLAIKKDPFFNALQIKYAYAVTCHKAQGGQWEYVFIDQGYLTKEMVDVSFLRWLYTALTRATKKVYLVNFNAEFFD